MTGPDRIWIDRYGGKWSHADGGTQDVEYIRRDPAVLAALPEVQALIAAARLDYRKLVAAISGNQSGTKCDACRNCGMIHCADAFYGCSGMRDYTPAEATAALAARDAAMRARGMREAAGIAWTMGRDAAAAWHTVQAETAMGALCCGSDNYEIRRAGRVSDMHRGHSEAIRAMPPPADLAAKIGGE